MRSAGMLYAAVAIAAAAPLKENVDHAGVPATTPTPKAVSFNIDRVRLSAGSLYWDAQRRNREYQLTLDNDQLLCEWTAAANLTECHKTDPTKPCATPGKIGMPKCSPLPGEMGPGGYYGHYLGHYLSGMAMMWNNTQDGAIKAKANTIVAGLKQVQDAWDAEGTVGYLFPYYPAVFGIMESRCGEPGPKIDYSVPYYTLHKMMAGLLDQYMLAGNTMALQMVIKLADWVVSRVEETFQRGGAKLWQCVLNTEWGGMNEVMYNLFAVTGTAQYHATGLRFNHWQWTAPLAIGDDDLDASHGNNGGNHANTHIPEIIGAARGYEVSGNLTQKNITTNFFNIVTSAHAWATGGSNDGEHWTTPMRMGDQLNGDTEESCTQYNMLKVARHLFLWSASPRFADYYERAIMNGIIGNQNRLDPDMTAFIYMLPLGAGGMRKPWGMSNSSFPCCWGTLTEQFSKMADSIYFATPDHSAVFINQFQSSSLEWLEQGATISQESGFPSEPDLTTTITVEVAKPGTEFTLNIRVPAWAATAANNSVTVNGVPVGGLTQGEYVAVARKWVSGDTVVCRFAMSLWASPVQDDRPEYNATMAWLYGPIVLAGLTPNDAVVPAGNPLAPSSFIKRNSTTELSFVATGSTYIGARTTFAMKPLYEITTESYSVYFHTNGVSRVNFNKDGAVVPTMSASDWQFTNAGVSPSKLPGSQDLRTDGPATVSTMTVVHPIVGQGHSIESVAFGFRYVAGYDDRNGSWPVLTAAFLDAATGKVIQTIYTSPPLDKYEWDHFNGYSPVIKVEKTGLGISNTDAVLLGFTVENHDHNLQIPLVTPDGLGALIKWASGPEDEPEWFTHSQFLHDHEAL